jgi:hypothetical protein
MFHERICLIWQKAFLETYYEMTNNFSIKYLLILRRVLPYSIILLFCLIIFETNVYGAELFSVQSISIEGKILSVIPEDINENGPSELIVLSKTGNYPNERRWISLYKANKNFEYKASATQRWEIDSLATMVEVGDIAPFPGKEIFYLTNSGISYYRQEEDGKFAIASQKLIELPTITLSKVKSYLPRSHLLDDWKGNNREELLLPQFNTLTFYDRSEKGQWRISETVKVTPRTFIFSDNEDDGGAFRDYSIHAEFRLPRIFMRDFNGDQLQDLLLTEQETLTVYLQNKDGKFSTEPSHANIFQVRPTGKEADVNLFFLMTPVDLNGDKYVDVVLTLTKGTGKFLEQEIIIFIFLNKKNIESPFSNKPDQMIIERGVTPGVHIIDVNSDGLTDLHLTKIKLGFWKIIQNLISKRVNLDTTIYMLRRDNRYPDEPNFSLKSDYKIDLTHRIRFRGTWPTLRSDINNDGFIDLLVPRDGKIEIFLNTLSENLFKTALAQSGVSTSAFMKISDLNHDGFNDLLFYDKKRNGTFSVLLNNGNWKRYSSSNNISNE